MAKKIKRIDLEEYIKSLLKTTKRLNIRKVIEGENGTTLYSHMKKWFLDDMKTMTGTENGYDVDKDLIRFDIKPPQTGTVWLVIFPFNYTTGEFIGSETKILFTNNRSRVNATEAEIEKAPEEVKNAFDRFIAAAEELGYLLPAAENQISLNWYRVEISYSADTPDTVDTRITAYPYFKAKSEYDAVRRAEEYFRLHPKKDVRILRAEQRRLKITGGSQEREPNVILNLDGR